MKTRLYALGFSRLSGLGGASAASLARAWALRRRRFSRSAAASLSSREGVGLGGVLPDFFIEMASGSRGAWHQGVAGRPWLGLRDAAPNGPWLL